MLYSEEIKTTTTTKVIDIYHISEDFGGMVY